ELRPGGPSPLPRSGGGRRSEPPRAKPPTPAAASRLRPSPASNATTSAPSAPTAWPATPPSPASANGKTAGPAVRSADQGVDPGGENPTATRDKLRAGVYKGSTGPAGATGPAGPSPSSSPTSISRAELKVVRRYPPLRVGSSTAIARLVG